MTDSNPPLRVGDIRADVKNQLAYLVVQNCFKREMIRLYLTGVMDIGSIYPPSEEDVFICTIKRNFFESLGELVKKHAGIA